MSAERAVCNTPDRCSEQHSYAPGCLLNRADSTTHVCGRCDLPTDPGELIDLDMQPVCQPCAHHLVPELGDLDHGRDA